MRGDAPRGCRSPSTGGDGLRNPLRAFGSDEKKGSAARSCSACTRPTPPALPLIPSASTHPSTMSRPARLLSALAHPHATRPHSTLIQRLTLPQEAAIPRTLNALSQPLPPAAQPQHVHVNHPSRLFPTLGPAEWPQVVEQNSQAVKERVLRGVTGLDVDEVRGLTRFTVVLKRVVNMTKKGKM